MKGVVISISNPHEEQLKQEAAKAFAEYFARRPLVVGDVLAGSEVHDRPPEGLAPNQMELVRVTPAMAYRHNYDLIFGAKS